MSAPEPWDRLPNESVQAYTAFSAYRDLGTGRTADEAYRAVRGRSGERSEGGKGAVRRWQSWSKSHRWVERAKAYDAHLEALKQKGVATETISQGRIWAERHAKLYETIHDAAGHVLRQARSLAMMPTARQEVTTPDGRTTIIEAVDPVHIRTASGVIKQMLEVADSMCGRMVDNENRAAALAAEIPIVQAGPGTENGAVQAAAAAELLGFRASQRLEILKMPTEPPDDPTPPAPLPEAGT